MALLVRPSSNETGWFGVFQTLGENRAREIYTSPSQNECYDVANECENNKTLLDDLIYLTEQHGER